MSKKKLREWVERFGDWLARRRARKSAKKYRGIMTLKIAMACDGDRPKYRDEITVWEAREL